jgi:hypothetical protein
VDAVERRLRLRLLLAVDGADVAVVAQGGAGQRRAGRLADLARE